MVFAAIGRTEILYYTITRLIKNGHRLSFIVNCRSSPEDTKKEEDFFNLAKRLSVPYILENKIKISILKELASSNVCPTVCVSVNYLNVIGNDVIDFFELGILNAHAGDLPKYRGNAPVAWAMLQGEEKIGLCIHKMKAGELDSGLIIERDYYSLNPNSKIKEVFDWIKVITPKLFDDSLNKLSSNPNYFLDNQSKSNYPIIRGLPRNVDDLKVNWKNKANYIDRHIRVSGDPFGGAYFLIGDKRIIIEEAKIKEDKTIYLGEPGQVIERNRNFVSVLTGDGVLELIKVKVNNEVYAAFEIIKSTRVRLL